MPTASLMATIDRLPVSGVPLSVSARCQRLEIRADLVGDPDPTWLRSRFGGELAYALPSRQHGGACVADGARRERLRRAASQYDFVALEPDDLRPSLLAAVPPRKRILTAHAATSTVAGLQALLEQLSSVPAHLYRLTTCASRPGDAVAPLALLKSAGRRDVTAYATGLAGAWTRILCAWLGAPIVSGSHGSEDGSDGQLSIDRLASDFGLPDVGPIDALFGMVGCPVLQSPSARIHNSAFRAVGRRALYLPFHAEIFTDFWRDVVECRALETLGFGVQGLSVVSPHKAAAMSVVAAGSAMARRAASTNLVHKRAGVWTAETTDADGVLLTLRARGVRCRAQRAAVIGCGGSGRAMAVALQEAGADVTLVNRGAERGALARRLLSLPLQPLAGFSAEPFAIVVNATPVGRCGDVLPFPVERLRRDAVVVDLAYGDRPTPLVKYARAAGRTTIDGWDMLVTQALRQFELMTGHGMPPGLAQQALGLEEPLAVGGEC
jgi:3-dehydroquinate dehydratase / shikimate dehydrogenase